MGKIVSIAVLKSILNKAFEQYVFDRVDNILGTADNVNPKYCKATATVGSVLAELMAIASALEEQRPELLRLVMDFEFAATYESALAAEIVYREGLRACCRVRQEFSAFILEKTAL